MAAWSSTTHDRHCAQSGARWGTTTSSPRAQPVPGLRDVPPRPDGALLPTRPPRPNPTFRYPHEHAAASPALISAITTPRALPERPPDHDDRRPPPPKMRPFSSRRRRRPPLLPPPRSSPAVRLGCGHSQCPLPESGRDFRGGGAREMLVPSPRARASSDRSETGVPRNGEKPRDNPETTQRQTGDRGRHPWYTPSSGQCAHSGQCTRPNRRRAPRLRASIRRGGRCRLPPIRVLGLPSRLSSARPVRPDFRSAPHRPLLCSGDRSELLGVSTSTELAKGPSTSFPRGQCSEFYSTGPATSGMPILRSASTWVKSRVA